MLRKRKKQFKDNLRLSEEKLSAIKLNNFLEDKNEGVGGIHSPKVRTRLSSVTLFYVMNRKGSYQ